jgi:hypothetical protein
VGRPSPFYKIMPKKYSLKMDKFHHRVAILKTAGNEDMENISLLCFVAR